MSEIIVAAKHSAGLPAVALVQRMDYDGSSNLIYEGYALPGTATSDAGWAIRKYTWTNGSMTLSQWAGGSVEMASIWDNRASLSYS